MKAANKLFLENNRDAYDEILNAQTATKANRVKYEFARIMREEFIGGYVITFDCGSCLFDMVKLLYQRFDQWLAEQPKETLKVYATFPSNKEKTTDLPGINSNEVIPVDPQFIKPAFIKVPHKNHHRK
jgi:hypothetical protein